MYIRDYTGFGDPQPAPADTPLLKKAPPFLVFSRIGPFAVDKSTLTPQLKQQVTRVVDFVRARLNTAQPIGVVRVVGHTDWSGTEPHNKDLGNRRTEAVRDELRVQLGDVLKRVLIEVEASPGKSKPIGDNLYGEGPGGQSTRRRVCRAADSTGSPLAERQDLRLDGSGSGSRGNLGSVPIKRGMPDPLGGKTARQFLLDVCENKFGKSRCKTVVDKAISAGCTGLEALFTEIGGTLSEDQKDALKKRCKEGADKPM